jgi:MYXO-CTERM domain-containing protein
MPLLHLADVTPADCPAQSSTGICSSKWPPIAATIGADAGAPPVPDGGVKPPKSSGGCGCEIGSPARALEGALALVALLLIARARRRAQGAVHR